MRRYIAIGALTLLPGCAVWSDGATVDYSRLLNIPITFIAGGGSTGGSTSPWEADKGWKQNSSKEYYGAPWSSQNIGDLKFINYSSGKTAVCHTVHGVEFCN